MRNRQLAAVAFALGLACAAPAARAFPGGSLLIVEPNVGVKLWTPGGGTGTSSLVISGAPLSDPRGIAVDHAGNVLVADRTAGTFRYSPTGAFQTSMGTGAIDVTVAPSGAVYILNDSGEVYLLSPPNQTLVASSIPTPRGIASTQDASGNDVVVVTTGANEILRVLPGPTTVIANGFLADSNIQRPGVDRFGNLLVPYPGNVLVFDPSNGIFRGAFGSSTILTPTDVTATSGDRYFVADGYPGGACRILEIDPIRGGVTVAATTPICTHTPWSVAAVPGGTSSPKLATGDIVLSDTGAFGGAGGIFRVNPTSGAVRALRLGGPWVGGLPVQLSTLRVGPTRELYAHTFRGVHRIDPGTGRATLVADMGLPSIEGSAFLANGDLMLSVVDSSGGRLARLERATGDLSTYTTIDPEQWGPPQALMIPYRQHLQPPPGYGYLLTSVPGPPFYVASFDLTPSPTFEVWGLLSKDDTLDMAAAPPDGRGFYAVSAPTEIERAWQSLTVFTSGGMLSAITGIDVEEDGNVVVADSNAFGGGGGVIRVNATTGVQTRVTTTPFVDPAGIAVVPPPSCSDGVDNDGDGLVDYPADPGCLTADDPWETVDCNDGIDNDGDGKVDYGANGDPSCASANYGFEQTQCSDGADNDGDGRIDLDDPQCTSATVNKESGSACGLLGIEVVGVAGWAIARTARRKRRGGETR